VMTEIDKLAELPKSWVWVELGDLGQVNLGKTPRKTQYLDDGEHKIIKFRDIVENEIDWSITNKGFVIDSEDVTRKLRELFKGDILITASAHASEHIGKKGACVLEIPKEFKKVFYVGELLCVRVIEEHINPKIVYYFLMSQDGYKFIQKRVRGVHLIGSEARRIFIPLPPLPEQHHIIEKIEELFTKLDAGVETLKKTKAQLKRYRQSVLKSAVEGELTEEWREAHKGELEPASVLLEQILKERRAKWEAEQLEKMKAKGKTPKNDSWKKKYKEPSGPDTTDLPILPEGWVWTNFEGLAEIGPHPLKAGPFGSTLKKEFYVPKGYKIYGQEQVIRGEPFYGNYYIDEGRYEKLKSCLVKPGDILVSLVGTIGKVLILPEGIEQGIINPRLVKLSLDRRLVNPKYVKTYLESSSVRHYFSLVSHGGTMDILNLTILRELPISLPPLREQEVIQSEVDRRLSIADEVETTIDAELKRSERLRQSILKQAFSGKLVPQDTTDEPVEKLLERIKEEKTKLEAEKKPRKRLKVRKVTKQRRLL